VFGAISAVCEVRGSGLVDQVRTDFIAQKCADLCISFSLFRQRRSSSDFCQSPNPLRRSEKVEQHNVLFPF
jgi:hypothetical protein